MSDSRNNTLNTINQFLSIVDAKIEDVCIKGKKSLPATTVAKELCGQFGWEWPAAYHLIHIHMSARPEFYMRKGPTGGWTLRPEFTAVEAKTLDTVVGTG